MMPRRREATRFEHRGMLETSYSKPKIRIYLLMLRMRQNFVICGNKKDIMLRNIFKMYKS